MDEQQIEIKQETERVLLEQQATNAIKELYNKGYYQELAYVRDVAQKRITELRR